LAARRKKPINTRWTDFLTTNRINEDGILITQRAIETGEAQHTFPSRTQNARWSHTVGRSQRSAVVRDGKTVAIVGALVDVTKRTQIEQALQHQAFHDPLTDLPNRALFMDRLEHALARSNRQKQQSAVLFLDLDRFKIVNDSLGHEVGDLLLKGVAKRCKVACVPATRRRVWAAMNSRFSSKTSAM
jgi:predicted signal transduction protein with EAL and GGDEF domain